MAPSSPEMGPPWTVFQKNYVLPPRKMHLGQTHCEVLAFLLWFSIHLGTKCEVRHLNPFFSFISMFASESHRWMMSCPLSFFLNPDLFGGHGPLREASLLLSSPVRSTF